jgi:hypothetical protein
MSWSDEKCPRSDGPHCPHDVMPFRQFGAREIDEFCCCCGTRSTVVLGVVQGGDGAHGPFLKVYQRRFHNPRDAA